MARENEYLTRLETAELLRMSERHFDRLRKTPGFPEPLEVAVTGRRPHLLWDRRDIDAWLLEQRGPAALLPELDSFYKDQAANRS